MHGVLAECSERSSMANTTPACRSPKMISTDCWFSFDFFGSCRFLNYPHLAEPYSLKTLCRLTNTLVPLVTLRFCEVLVGVTTQDDV